VPGRFTPLPDEINPPISTTHSTRLPDTDSTRTRTRPSSISSSLPACTTWARPGKVTSMSVASPSPVAASTSRSPTLTVRGMSSFPIRILGPWRSAITASGRPITCCARRTAETTAR